MEKSNVHQHTNTTLLSPSFLREIERSQNILICGCGGGFDFVHSMLLYPELKRQNKNVTIGSFSFGSPDNITNAEVVFSETVPDGKCVAKIVTHASEGSSRYCPEVRLCGFLDLEYPQEAPHSVYAYYARNFSVPLLSRLYKQLIAHHNIDTIIIIDGGTDSLMKGDENGLGDPIEDCVSVTTVAKLDVDVGIRKKLLLTFGFGMDRFNGVSDADSLRAIAELIELDGFKGSLSIEKNSETFLFYKRCLDYLYAGQSFRSVMSSGLVAAVEGRYGYYVPDDVASRVRNGGLFVWPLMATIWAFDPVVVSKRSLISSWIQDCQYYVECSDALTFERRKLHEAGLIRQIQNLPNQHEIFDKRFRDPQNNRDIIIPSPTSHKKDHTFKYTLFGIVGLGFATYVLLHPHWLPYFNRNK